MKASEWASDRIKEAFDLVAQDEARKVSVVQEIMFKSTDCLRRIIAPVGGYGGVTMSSLVPELQQFPSGRPRLDGLWEKEPQGGAGHSLWRKVRLETTKQAVGGPNRRKFLAGKGLQSACGTIKACAQI